jgi:pyrrolidone-carboxylate peptidase
MIKVVKTLILILVTQNVWGKPLVLLTHFDPFGRSTTNNSKEVAELIRQELQTDEDLEVGLCELSTSFGKAYSQLQECLRAQPSAPALILSLGEATCDYKIETLARNRDHTYRPDNDGEERNNQKIMDGNGDYLGLSMTAENMFCGLTKKEQKHFSISSNAGSFVCNNLIYRFTHDYPQENFSFIHVAHSKCKNVKEKNIRSVPLIIKMMKAGVLNPSVRIIPTSRAQLKLEINSRVNSCERNFYRSLKRTDEPIF